ncbi:SRPBCC domain-containing protein [Sporosarcina sp. P26b]|uniref:SRPBCC family protein n=1 Tax=Sporosarcina TaxID=1569 RepID=UPI000A17E87C|nr:MULTISPECIES: SRPBCC domain-containing protein [Sporosarcina]ARK20497.1 ATPase [Sporosarcina ureae]PIC74695.1 SRPBCC domain-containing protein [Sporosarcina sp. P17b]PIC97665.1 SRPBCC domain-containing protein [Sporosarcina sp. P26b]
MSKVSSTSLKMIRNFEVAPEIVFDAWLKPEMMRKWFFTLEGTNKVTRNNPQVGGTWEIIDHRGGQDYRAIGEYLELDSPKKIKLTFKMPEMSDLEDTLTVELKELEKGCEMTFLQLIHVAQELNSTDPEIKIALDEMRDGTEVGWNYMFMGLKELVETGEVSYKG